MAILLANCGDSGAVDETLAAGKARACLPWDCDDKERCRSVELDSFDFDNQCFTTREYACFERESCVEGEFFAQGNDRTVRVRGCVNIDFWEDWFVVDEPPLGNTEHGRDIVLGLARVDRGELRALLRRTMPDRATVHRL